MKSRLLLLSFAAVATLAAIGPANAGPAYRACLHASAERYMMGEDLPGGGGSLGYAILQAASYCSGTMRLSPY